MQELLDAARDDNLSSNMLNASDARLAKGRFAGPFDTATITTTPAESGHNP